MVISPSIATFDNIRKYAQVTGTNLGNLNVETCSSEAIKYYPKNVALGIEIETGDTEKGMIDSSEALSSPYALKSF